MCLSKILKWKTETGWCCTVLNLDKNWNFIEFEKYWKDDLGKYEYKGGPSSIINKCVKEQRLDNQKISY